MVQSRSGYEANSPQGLGNFLVEVGVFSQGKADLLSKQEFRSIEDLFSQAAKFITLGRASAEKKVEDRFVLSILELPFVDRCLAAQEMGYNTVMRILLSSLDKRYNSLTFMSLTQTQKAYYIKTFTRFRQDEFHVISLTGDPEADCVSVLKCF